MRNKSSKSKQVSSSHKVQQKVYIESADLYNKILATFLVEKFFTELEVRRAFNLSNCLNLSKKLHQMIDNRFLSVVPFSTPQNEHLYQINYQIDPKVCSFKNIKMVVSVLLQKHL
ncbi:hypothetical protein M153_5130003311 [Pseudoloma neurophilia]|uniref:Uncharacterized protein n=1 Tax=Pseudoloma neurophilia TaxID=146866 RepID=A0A0R0LX06_9MICR|nr:hypothetical protein M153_5130003311 [Pseudoloma neurophilia]